MNKGNKRIAATLIFVLFCGTSAALFIPNSPTLIIYSFFLALVVLLQFLGFNPLAIVSAGLSIVLGIYLMNRVGPEYMMSIPVLIIVMIVSLSFIHFHLQKIGEQLKINRKEIEMIEDEKKMVQKEVDYYEQRRRAYLDRLGQRRHLVNAARAMGSLLDPAAIQEKLIESAQILFPHQPVQISYGQTGDVADNYVIQKKQSILIPFGPYKGDHLMAAPVTMQNQLAAIVRVGGESDSPEYSREDLRLLEILGSLASLALDNTALFQQVQETALRDALTGLLTHRAFQDHLDESIKEASRFGNPLSIVLADVDHFKSVNDTHGHQAGDQVLQGFAHIIDRNVRDVDIVARYGGEEFILLLPQADHDEAIKIAESIRTDLEAQEFSVGAKSISITSSFGISSFPVDATSSEQLIRQADQRLYKAKEGGRNQVVG